MAPQITTITAPRGPAWTSLPFEIWTMIMCLMMGPSDIGSTWVKCRAVSRTFRKAVELAVRVSIVPRVTLHFVNARENLVKVPGIEDLVGGITMPLEFVRFTGDGTRATFRLDQEKLKQARVMNISNPAWDHSANTMMVRRGNVQITFSDYTKAQIRDSLARLGRAGADPLSDHPPWYLPVVSYTCAARLRCFDNIEVDIENIGMTLPWKTIIAPLLKEEATIATGFKANALRDVERGLRMERAPSSRMVEGLKLALSSHRCRRIRFKIAIEHALASSNSKRHREFKKNGVLDDYSEAHGVCGPASQYFVYQDWKVMALDYTNLWYHD